MFVESMFDPRWTAALDEFERTGSIHIRGMALELRGERIDVAAYTRTEPRDIEEWLARLLMQQAVARFEALRAEDERFAAIVLGRRPQPIVIHDYLRAGAVVCSLEDGGSIRWVIPRRP